MEQRARHSGNRIGCRFVLPAALARRVGKHDAPALFRGIAYGRVDGLGANLFDAPNRVSQLPYGQ
jgi:hypothetical protein